MNLRQLINTGLETGELTGELYVHNINSPVEDADAVGEGVALPITQITADDQGNLLVQYAGPMPVEEE